MAQQRTASRLLGMNEVLVAGSIVTEQEQAALVGWAEAKRRSGRLLENPQDPGVFSTPYRTSDGNLTRFTKDGPRQTESRDLVWVPSVDERKFDPLPAAFWDIRTRVIELLGLHALEEDPYKGSFLSYVAPGGKIHQHRDAALKLGDEDCQLLRCNVLFKKAAGGGLPVIGGKEVDVPDRGMWAFFPTAVVHSATEVRGAQLRGVLSFGFVVRAADLEQRRFRVARTVEAAFGLDAGEGARRDLIRQLRESPEAAAIGRERLDVFDFVLSSGGDFSVRETAESLRRDPAEIGEVFRDLQRAELIESSSSAASQRGTITVL